MSAALHMDEPETYLSEAVPASAAAERRLASLVDGQYDFVWRSVRRLGVREGDADDAAQHVFLVAARKLELIREGSERSFLYQTALRIASDYRRSRLRKFEAQFQEISDYTGSDESQPSTDELLDLRRARLQLDAILDQMNFDLRAVFVLHELEQATMAEIATLLDVPSGTVASRLRRARVEFGEILSTQQEARRIGRESLS